MNPMTLWDSTRSSSNLKITRLVLCEIDPMNQQYRRAYSVNSTGDVTQQIRERVDQVQFSPDAIYGGLFSGALSNYITPEVAPSAVNIPGGWGNHRFFFIMEVEIHTELNVKTEVVTGFTDRAEISIAGTLDPDTEFYIDNVVILRNVPTTTATGHRYIHQELSSANHVLTNHNFGSQTNVFDGSPIPSTTRPTDVFSAILRNESGYGMDAFDVRTTLTKPKMSNRNNNLQSQFMASVVGGALLAKSPTGMSDGIHLYGDAIGKTVELSTTDVDFMSWVKGRGMQLASSFPYKMLTSADPTLLDQSAASRVKVITRGRALTRVNENHLTSGFAGHSNESSSWDDRGITVLAATMISNGLPSLMITHGVGDIAFRATNVNVSPGMPVMFVYERAPDYLTSSPMPNALPRLQYAIVNDLLAAISINNSMSFDVRVSCSVFGHIEIEIQIESEKSRYVSPGFASSLFVPVVTNSADRLNEIGSSFKYLIDDVLGVTKSSSFGDGLLATSSDGFSNMI